MLLSSFMSVLVQEFIYITIVCYSFCQGASIGINFGLESTFFFVRAVDVLHGVPGFGWRGALGELAGWKNKSLVWWSCSTKSMRRRVHKISPYAVLSSAAFTKEPFIFVALLYCSMNWSRVSAFCTADATKSMSSRNCGAWVALS